MIQVGDIIVSRELLANQFVCHLEKCGGNCCVYGDSGAPLEKEEAEKVECNIGSIQPFMSQKGLEAVDRQGTWIIDRDGDRVTPLVNNEECAYACFEKGIARCAIEKAYENGSVRFQKPVSCHLYPARVTRLKETVALNYHKWSICEPARILGNKEETPVFRFLRDALTRVFGKEFYEELERIFDQLPAERA